VLRLWNGRPRRYVNRSSWVLNHRFAWMSLFSVAVGVVLALALEPLARAASTDELPAKFQAYPYSVMSLSVGRPNRGWQLRAKRLRNTPELEVRQRSRGRNYGHPALVLMLGRSAKEIAKAVRGSRMLVGDLSRERGGPLDGHNSHQSGRDADVGFYIKDARGVAIPLAQEFVKFGGDGKAMDGSGRLFDDHRNWLLVQSWVKDRRAGLSHIFVSTPLRTRLLRFGQSNPEFRPYVAEAVKLLKQPEYAEAHDDHFHVRINCPADQAGLCLGASSR
jgi:penicillin-insensitive murein DD-endopeptidase